MNTSTNQYTVEKTKQTTAVLNRPNTLRALLSLSFCTLQFTSRSKSCCLPRQPATFPVRVQLHPTLGCKREFNVIHVAHIGVGVLQRKLFDLLEVHANLSHRFFIRAAGQQAVPGDININVRTDTSGGGSRPSRVRSTYCWRVTDSRANRSHATTAPSNPWEMSVSRGRRCTCESICTH